MCSIHVAEEEAHTAEFIERMYQLFNAFNSQKLTSPALMSHGLTETSGQKLCLLWILDWLSKIKSNGIDGSISILLDMSFVVYILDYYMYQVDLNLNKLHILTFKIKPRQAFSNILPVMLWPTPEVYSWALSVMLVFHVYFRPLTVHKIPFMAILLLKHNIKTWSLVVA